MKRILSLILVLLMTFSMVLRVFAEEAMTFDKTWQYQATSIPAELPATFEATFKFPVDAKYEYNSTIFGSYINSYASGMIFGINTDGNPYLHLSNEENQSATAAFKTVNVFTGEWIHLIITWDKATNTLTCYINGEAKETLTQEFPENINLHYPLTLGSDSRAVNRYRFEGELKAAALYQEPVTADKIATLNNEPFQMEGMMMGYDLSAGGTPEKIADKSGNGNDMILKQSFLEEMKPIDKYAYSFAVLGDPQWLSNLHPDKLTNMFEWIKENAEGKKIKHLFTVGDLTHNSTAGEWIMIWDSLEEIQELVPYTPVRGNHDKIKDFKKYFKYSDYEERIDGCFEENMLNSYQCFEVGKIPYLSLTLDYSVTDEALEWANEVVASHPDHNVIISTHSYLVANGDLNLNKNSDQNNSGQEIWDKLVRKHKNIALVLCGHVTSDRIAVSQMKGDHGNTVTQMMINAQSADHELEGIGVVTMLYFSKDGKKMQVEHYSTEKDALFLEENQFSLELDLLETPASPLIWVIGGAAILLLLGAGVLFLILKKKKQA